MSTASLRTFVACAAVGTGLLLGSGIAAAQTPDAPSTTGAVADPHALVGQFIRVLNTGSSGICVPIATGSNVGTPGCG
ncbi:hypothetical protein ACIBCN_34965 [Nocardia sp. NPDC051052]|uniref:hypothetical protein n=1 Tax=Nocardia sp. NPDC051052 TaxID=3364322 RepID=UPI0037BA8614